MYERAKKIITERKQEVEKLANLLLQKESLELDELTDLLGPSQNRNKEAFSGYIQDLKKKKAEQADKKNVKEDKKDDKKDGKGKEGDEKTIKGEHAA